MVQRRTDLAIEAQELWQESVQETTKLPGVVAESRKREGLVVHRVDILDDQGAQALGKPQGRYVTLEVEGLSSRAEDIFGRAIRAVAGELAPMLPQGIGASVLVVGLGNRAITPDAIGPQVADSTLVTRHLIQRLPEQFGTFRPVTALATGVLGTTGVESSELVRALVEEIHPACVIAVDALAARSMHRVCQSVQIADTGIVPGSGVGNHRGALNRETLGIPVVAVGVPTVVDAATLCADVLEQAGQTQFDLGAIPDAQLMVTPKDIDQQVADLSKILAYGINLALQPGLGLEELEMLVG